MLTFLFVVFAIYVAYNFIKVMIYGRNIFRPDFKRIDDKIREECGFANWNTPFGKTVYYIELLIFLTIIVAIVCSIVR